MKKIDVKVVIGSNYGDECKGLATRFFAEQAKPDEKCLNVLFNGGCQRGHTVELKDGTRHVFHHFGSGTFSGADNYFDSLFIVNPIFFIDEYERLSDKVQLKCFASRLCKVSTPYDIFINQIVEKSRGENRHGSCGYGIWETIERYNNSVADRSYIETLNYSLGEMLRFPDELLRILLKAVAEKYVPYRLKQYGIEEVPEEYRELLNSDSLIEHYISDLRKLGTLVEIKEFPDLAREYDLVVFEGAQGLALSQGNKEEYPNVTASDTTSYVPVCRMARNDINCNIEICYVTRSYFTRHGAGKFPTECKKSSINNDIVDSTNVYNDFQESIRYGKFSKYDFFNRVCKDASLAKSIMADKVKFSVFISHLNYTDGNICGDCTIKDLSDKFDNVYLSETKYSEDVEKYFDGISW